MLYTALTIALGIVFAVTILGVGAALIGAWAMAKPGVRPGLDPRLDRAND